MRLLRLALLNLARNRRRTFISLLVIAAGTVGILLTAGFIAFSFDGLREALISGGLGHLEVVDSSVAGSTATLERSMEAGLEDWRSLQETLEAQPRVVAASPTVHLMGMASQPGGRSVSFIGLGVDPEREARMGFEVKLREGDDLPPAEPLPGEDRVLLARGLAESLDAGPGDYVTLLAMTPGGMLNALDVTVAGIVTTGVQDLDTRYLKLHRASAQRLLQSDAVSNLVVGLDATPATDQVAARLREVLEGHDPPLAVVSWQERAPFFAQVKNLYLGIFWFLGSVIFVLVVLSVSNTLVMAILERVRELGTLRALGTSRGQVAALVFWEAVWLGLLGALLGNAVGFLMIVGINALELKMPPPPGAVDPIDLQLTLVPEAFLGSIALMLLVLALAAILPVVKAIRLEIVEALGHV